MTPTVYFSWAAAETADPGPGAFAWSLLVVLLVLSALGGWAVSGVILKRLREDDRATPSIGPWGEPDLAAPSTSADAMAEVAELEALWRQSGPRGRASSD